MEKALIFAQWTCALYLMGLIWTIQMVHYPSFHYVDMQKFIEFGDFHGQRITPIVAPVMIVELVTALLLAFSWGHRWGFLNAITVILLWAVTFLISVPCHTALQNGYDAGIVQRLVLTNWLRTILWSLRAIGWTYWFYMYR